MDVLNLFVVAAFLLSAFLGWLTIPQIVLISKEKRLFDVLSERKSHTGAIPRLGGVAFFPAFIFSLSLVIGMRYCYGLTISPFFEMDVMRELAFLLAGGTVLYLVGLADDLKGLSYKTKFVAQVIAAILLLYSGNMITNLGGLFGIHHIPVLLGAFLTILLVVLLVNAYNLIDGIDGLCSGLSILTLLALGGWFWWQGIYIYALIANAMLGVVAVFFFFNVGGKRLKIFMGDTGSLTLGFLITFLALRFYNLNVDTEMFQVDSAPAVVLGILFVPAFDTLRVFCERMRNGLSPFHPDRRHIHHILLQLGLNHMESSMIIIGFQAFFILLNILLKDIDINLLFALNIALGIGSITLLKVLIRRRAERTVEAEAVVERGGVGEAEKG